MDKKWNIEEWLEYCEKSKEIIRKIGNGKLNPSKKDIYEYFEERISYVIGVQKKHTLFTYTPNVYVLDAEGRRNEIGLVRKLKYDVYCMQEERYTVQCKMEKIKKSLEMLEEAGVDVSEEIEKLKISEEEEEIINKKIQEIEKRLNQDVIDKIYAYTYVQVKSRHIISEKQSMIDKEKNKNKNYEKKIRNLINSIQQNQDPEIDKGILKKKENKKIENLMEMKKNKEDLKFFTNILQKFENMEEPKGIANDFDRKIDEKKLTIKPGRSKEKRILESIDIKFLEKIIEMFPSKREKDNIALEMCKCSEKNRLELLDIIKELSEKNLLCNNSLFYTYHAPEEVRKIIEEKWEKNEEECKKIIEENWKKNEEEWIKEYKKECEELIEDNWKKKYENVYKNKKQIEEMLAEEFGAEFTNAIKESYKRRLGEKLKKSYEEIHIMKIKKEWEKEYEEEYRKQIDKEWKCGLEIRLKYPALVCERELFALLFIMIDGDLKKGRERKTYFKLEKEIDKIIDKIDNRFGDDYIVRIKRKMNELCNLMEVGIRTSYENGTLEDILNQEINIYQEKKGKSVCMRLLEKIKKLDVYYEIWENNVSLLQHIEGEKWVKEIADYLDQNPEDFSTTYTRIYSLYENIIEEFGGEEMAVINMINDDSSIIML